MPSLRPIARAVASHRPFFAGGLVLVPIAAAVLVACGGGGMGSSSGSNGMASGQALASGTVTGFGSVYVNGIEYDTTSATVSDDLGNAQSQSAIKLGMQVQLTGQDPANSSSTGSARTIVFASDLEGPVDVVDTAQSSFTLLGQEVDINTDTVWDSALTGGLGGLTAGKLVKVFALYDNTTGRYVASRVESDAGATQYKVRGMVSKLDTGAKTYAVGNATIDYSGLATAPANLADGMIAAAELQTTVGANGWVATAIQMPNHGNPGDHATVHVRGIISAESGPMSFTLDGWPVDASGATFPSGQSVIVQGALVQVDGITSNGALVASNVDIQQPGLHGGLDFQVHGPIGSILSSQQTFVLRGTTVSFAGSVSFTGGTASDLAVGKKVLVQGKLAPDGNTVQAVTIAIGQ
jgi:hypothetical protein